jgi:glutaminyl-peptide cyclotransferase
MLRIMENPKMDMAKFLILLAALAACCGWSAAVPAAPAPERAFVVVAEHPHDISAYTEGLVYEDGHLYESTGLVGQSSLRESDAASGRLLRLRPLAAPYFGEGLARIGHRWLQLTWTSHIGFLYNDALQPVGRFDYRGEGWGLAYDGSVLLLSDGTAVVRLLDPSTFKEVGHIAVHDDGLPVARLNELEYAQGRIFANVFMTDRIAEIDPATGSVHAWLDLTSLHQSLKLPANWDERQNVANGIAFDPQSGHFFVTGKRWPTVFEIRLADDP